MLNKEIFGFLARIFYCKNNCHHTFNGFHTIINDFFIFANTILENAKMEHIAPNKKNTHRLKRKFALLVSPINFIIVFQNIIYICIF